MGGLVAWVSPETLTRVRELVPALGIELAGAFIGGLLAGWLVAWRAGRRWRRREFLDRINISLNAVQDGVLLLRTLHESSLEDVFLNSKAVRTVLRAARRTTVGDPILPIDDEDVSWHLLNSVLNVVSEQFAEGVVCRDLGLPVRCEHYVICLTCEAEGLTRTRKVRAMVVREDTLEQFAKVYAEAEPKLTSAYHKTRVRTLRVTARKHEMREEEHKFLDVEICVPVSGGRDARGA